MVDPEQMERNRTGLKPVVEVPGQKYYLPMATIPERKSTNLLQNWKDFVMGRFPEAYEGPTFSGFSTRMMERRVRCEIQKGEESPSPNR